MPKGRFTTRFGLNGEVVRIYPNAVEIWDWIPAALEIEDMDERAKKKEDVQRCLYLVGSLSGVDGVIEDATPVMMDQNTNTYVLVLTIQLKSERRFQMKKFGQFFIEDSVDKPLILPPFVHGLYPYTVKASERFVAISTDEGSLTIFDSEQGHPLPQSYDVLIMNGNPLFDVQGRYLSYVPSDPIDSPRTTLNVPTRNYSIYSKILQSLSITALDGIYKLTEIQSIKTMISENNVSANLKLYLSNLINGLKASQTVIIVDLVTGDQLANFSPPNGCQYISLSPFDTQLLTVSQRGDQVYRWDLSRMPIEVSLVDIQTRGKTASVIQDMYWVDNTTYTMVTRSSGSIHCFNTKDSKWIMPNMRALRVSSNSSEIFALVGDEIYNLEFNGISNAKYQLPDTPIPKSLLPDHIPVKPVEEVVVRTDIKDPVALKSTEALAQVEIQTCFLGQPIYDRIGFAKLKSHVTVTDIFGNDVKLQKVEFGKGCGEAIFSSDQEDLESAMKSVMMLSVDTDTVANDVI